MSLIKVADGVIINTDAIVSIMSDSDMTRIILSNDTHVDTLIPIDMFIMHINKPQVVVNSTELTP